MSTTPEALAPQSELPLDAPVTAPVSSPDGKPDGAADEAAPSAAAKQSTGETTEPEAKWVQKRIDELTRDRREAERRERDALKERDYWREQHKAQPTPAPEPEKTKTFADFNFDEAAFENYRLERVATAAEAKAEKRILEKQAEIEKAARSAEYVGKVKEFAKDHPDYEEVATYAPISNQVADIIIGVKSGPEVAYYLGKNPDVAMQISRLPDSYAAYEIGQIAARLQFEKTQANSARTLISKAPPPAPAIEAVNQVVQKDPKDMTQAEFNKWRRKQIAARKGWDSVE